ncbi:MAG: DUF5680 domain-containing protein [Candidatus Paceibacterota bacterium]|jgi:hypothetical protein
MEETPQSLEQLANIKKFLVEANRAGYGSGEEQVWTKEADGSTTISYESADKAWRFHDNFFGGEPYGGREIIFKDGHSEWMMIYYGEVSDKEIEKSAAYAFLRKALMNAPEDLPVRGPVHMSEVIDGKEWTYDNIYTGDLGRFSGHEYIKVDGKEIYDAEYAGGLVDVTRGV